MNNQKAYHLYLIVIFFAGFSFLTFEVSWFRIFSLITGATVKASTLVLAAFMAGFGTGAYYWGRIIRKNVNSRLILFSLFLIITVLGISSSYYHELTRLYTSCNEIIIYLISFLFLFIPAFFMGGVLPALSGIVIRSDNHLSKKIGLIYSLETLGSTLGGLFTGFFFLGSLGQQNTLFLASFINLVLAILVFINRKISSETTNQVVTAKKNNLKEIESSELRSKQKIALLSAFTCGFAVVGLQVVWLRIFRIYMTNTSYTFSLIASMVILGLFTGSWLFAKKSHSIVNHNRTMFRLLLYLSGFTLAGLFILLNMHTIVLFPLAKLQELHFIRIILIPLFSSILVIIPVTLLSGYAFPLACTMYTADYNDISRNVGRILLANTLGSVTGPVITAFLLIPLLGAGLSIMFMTIFILLFAYLISTITFSGKRFHPVRVVLIVTVLALMSVFIIKPDFYILPPSFNMFKKQILSYKETTEGTFVVGKETQGQNSVLSTYVNNSAVIGSNYDAIKAVKMVGHIPFYRGLHCRNVLIVGFGIGVTTSAIASHPEVEQVDCVELVSGLKDAAHFYNSLNNGIEKDPRLKIFSDDGRHYLQKSTKKYDLISSDPTHPILGSGNLYTKEYFELCRDHLNENGMVSQYLPLHKLMLNDLLGIIKTFHSVFPDASVWIGHFHLILIGTNGNSAIDFSEWTENISHSIKDPYFYNDPYHVASCLLLDSQQIREITTRMKINSDNNLYTEFFKLSSFDADNLTKNLLYLNENRAPLDRLFINIDDKEKMNRFVMGNKHLTQGLYYMLQGNNREFMNNLQAAITANPENEEYQFLLRYHFGKN